MSANNNSFQLIELDRDAGWTLILLRPDGSEHKRFEYLTSEFVDEARRELVPLCPSEFYSRAYDLAHMFAYADGMDWKQLSADAELLHTQHGSVLCEA